MVRKAKEEGIVNWGGLGLINGLLLCVIVVSMKVNEIDNKEVRKGKKFILIHIVFINFITGQQYFYLWI